MNTQSDSSAHVEPQASLAQFVGYFFWLGRRALAAPSRSLALQQDLVDARGWIRKEDYLEGLALAQLAPGPLAAQT